MISPEATVWALAPLFMILIVANEFDDVGFTLIMVSNEALLKSVKAVGVNFVKTVVDGVPDNTRVGIISPVPDPDVEKDTL